MHCSNKKLSAKKVEIFFPLVYFTMVHMLDGNSEHQALLCDGKEDISEIGFSLLSVNNMPLTDVITDFTHART